MDEAENQINDLEHKEAKNNQSEQQEEKKIQKNEDSVSSLWDTFKKYNICTIEGPEEKRQRKKLDIYLKNNERKLPQFCEENRHVSPWSTESQTR